MHEDVASIYQQQKAIGYESEFIEGEKDCMNYMKGIFDDWQAQGSHLFCMKKKVDMLLIKIQLKHLKISLPQMVFK